MTHVVTPGSPVILITTKVWATMAKIKTNTGHNQAWVLPEESSCVAEMTLLLFTALPAPGKEICYGHLGCFSDGKPWTGILQRPLKLFPWAPKDIDTRFLLYTNENPNNFQVRVGVETLPSGWIWVPTVEPSHGGLRKNAPPWSFPDDVSAPMFDLEPSQLSGS